MVWMLPASTTWVTEDGLVLLPFLRPLCFLLFVRRVPRPGAPLNFRMTSFE